MSALTDLFTAMANKIRSKTGTATTYTPSEMVSDGIDDVYDAGVAAGGTSTPITPSNSSPASMTSGTKYTPSTNGYAIASYDSVTPSSTPESVASGDIVKIGGSGVIVDAIPTPTSITPSNSSPVALAGKGLYRVAGDLGVTEGYAIESYSSKTPSDTSPASVSSGAIIKASSAGYLHKTAQGFTDYPLKIRNTSSSTSLSLTGLTSSKNYLLLVWNWGGSVSYSDTRFDSTTASGATITKIANLRDTGGSNVRVAGTFFLMKTSSTSVTLSNTNQMLALVFMAE